MIEDLATKIDIKEVAMNKTTSVDKGHDEISSTLVPDTWATMSGNLRETQETEGGSKELKVKADTCDKERSIIKACSINRVNGYQAHEFEEIAMENYVKEKMVNGHEEPFPTVVL